jgi:hypothetical protein
LIGAAASSSPHYPNPYYLNATPHTIQIVHRPLSEYHTDIFLHCITTIQPKFFRDDADGTICCQVLLPLQRYLHSHYLPLFFGASTVLLYFSSPSGSYALELLWPSPMRDIRVLFLQRPSSSEKDQ